MREDACLLPVAETTPAGHTGAEAEFLRQPLQAMPVERTNTTFAVTLLEQGEWLVAQGRREEAEPLLAEAQEIFERLEAKPRLDRLDAVPAGIPTEIPA